MTGNLICLCSHHHRMHHTGLLDISKPRGNVLLDELEALLAKELPGVQLKRYAKPTFAKPCPDELRRQIKAECAYVVEALAD